MMIEIKSVTKGYGEHTVLENVNITVDDCSVLGLAGFNGSGKTTLLKVCAGIFKADCGCVLLDGQNSFDNNNNRKTLFFVSDNFWFPTGSTIKTAAKFYSNYYPDFDYNLMNSVCELFGIDPKAHIRSLSKGMTKQAALAIAFAVRPKYLLIDETFDGLDPHMKEILRKLLLQYINETNASVIISSHDLGEISGVCDHIAIINGKNVILNCALEDVSEHFRRVKMIFSQPVNQSKFNGINYRKFKLSGRVVSMVICGDISCELQKLNDLGAESIETELLTLEEVFSEETEAMTDNEKIKSIFK